MCTAPYNVLQSKKKYLNVVKHFFIHISKKVLNFELTIREIIKDTQLDIQLD